MGDRVCVCECVYIYTLTHTHCVQCFEQCGEELYRENAEEINVENKFKRQREREGK